jgi:hypothetical protein
LKCGGVKLIFLRVGADKQAIGRDYSYCGIDWSEEFIRNVRDQR